MNTSQERNPLSTQPYRGTRDFYPELQRVRSWLFGVWRSVLESYGYEEYDAPLLEPLELYAAKSSEEIVSKQLYSFQDRGQRMVALRPELTPSLARMVAAKHKQLPRPIRWYAIPRCMRYERPQRGRLREFDQLNVDVFGGTPVDEDLETLSVCASIMAALEAPSGSFQIRLGDRRLLGSLLTHVGGVPDAKTAEALRLIDKRDKLSPDDFLSSWCAMMGSESISTHKRDVLDALISPQAGEREGPIERLLDPDSRVAWDHLQTLKETLEHAHPGLEVCLDPGLARGFDYYTGMVFEIFDTHPDNRRALFGGGRYDNLLAAFGESPLPGVGFGVSDVSLLNFCEVHGLEMGGAKSLDCAVLRFSPTDRLAALELANRLRAFGLSCTTTLNEQKFGKQIQAAEKLGARTVVFRGEDELRDGTFSIKWLGDGQQESLPMTETGFQELAKKMRPQEGAAS